MKFEVRLESGCELDTEWKAQGLAVAEWNGITFTLNQRGDYEVINPTDEQIKLALDTTFMVVVIYSYSPPLAPEWPF